MGLSTRVKKLTKNQWKVILLVISGIVIIFFALTFYNFHGRCEPVLSQSGIIEIKPASPSAIFVRNGEAMSIEKQVDTSYYWLGTNIKHKNGMLFYQDSGGVALMQLITPKAGIYSVELSDGSKVWLNAGSTLKFPNVFDKGFTRKVTLYGEGYFEINKKEQSPFVVTLPSGESFEIQTSPFNINTYDDEKHREFLLTEGEIRVNARRFPEGTELPDINLPDAKNNEICKMTPFAWRNNKFSFCDKPFEQVMNEIGRWYNVEIEFSTCYGVKERLFNGEFSRTITLNKLIALIEETEIAKFSLAGRRLEVYPFKK